MRRFICTAMVVLCGAMVPAAAQPPDVDGDAGGATTPHLLREGPALPHRFDDLSALRSRAVTADLSVLEQAAARETIAIELFDDTALTVTIERRPNDHTWIGHVDRMHDSTFVATILDGVLSAYLNAANLGTYRLRWLAGDMYIVQQIDQSQFPTCATSHQHAIADGGGGVAGGELCDDGSVIDVLVVYTPLAKSAMGGAGVIEAEIELAIATSNAAYVNSQIGMQLNLVYSGEVDYFETASYSGHLGHLTDPVDGVMDEVHVLRKDYEADLVALLVDDGEYCGVAWLMSDLGLGFESFAFSVTSWFCAVDNLTFPHELGHNMGSHHDRQNAGGDPVFDYSYGYRYFGAQDEWRTIMAYSPGTRIPYHSNPDVFFDGGATGVDIEAPDSAHNAMSIDNARFTVASFRCSAPGDLDGDGAVGSADLLILLGAWGACGNCDDCPADFDADCTVGTADLLVLLGNWG